MSLLLASFSSNALFGQNNASSTSSPISQSNEVFNNNNGFVPVDLAFEFTSVQQDNSVYLNWKIKQGYYLYQQRLTVSAENAEIGKLELEDGEPYLDEFFGSVNIYKQILNSNVPLLSVGENARLIVQYQGCAEAGFCYPPETRVVELSPITTIRSDSQVQDKAQVITANPDTSSQNISDTNIRSNNRSNNGSQLAEQLAEKWWTPLLFLALGVGLAFTPCVFPMYPILTGIVLGKGKLSHLNAFTLSFVYVQGMALTYTLLGLVVASAGLQFQAALQHPAILIGLSFVFILLALSMFGLYTIQLPSKLQTWLTTQSNKQKGGSMLGVFAMGAISGLVCSPCTTAPLSGALLYVAQSGNLATGGIALYALGLGMGIPLILVAVFGNKLLPKAGVWMERVKVLFGFILLAAPIYLIERLVSEQWAVTLWGSLGIIFFGWLYHLKNHFEFGGWKQSLLGIIAILGILASALPIYQTFNGQHEDITNSQQSKVQFIRIHSVQELNNQLVLANKANKPVMLDFYADWCVACKEFEKYTFHHPEVQNKLAGFVLLQADVTKNSKQDIELFKRLKVMGLPTIDFWNANGERISNGRITGFLEAEAFLQHLEQHNL